MNYELRSLNEISPASLDLDRAQLLLKFNNAFLSELSDLQSEKRDVCVMFLDIRRHDGQRPCAGTGEWDRYISVGLIVRIVLEKHLTDGSQ